MAGRGASAESSFLSACRSCKLDKIRVSLDALVAASPVSHAWEPPQQRRRRVLLSATSTFGGTALHSVLANYSNPSQQKDSSCFESQQKDSSWFESIVFLLHEGGEECQEWVNRVAGYGRTAAGNMLMRSPRAKESMDDKQTLCAVALLAYGAVPVVDDVPGRLMSEDRASDRLLQQARRVGSGRQVARDFLLSAEGVALLDTPPGKLVATLPGVQSIVRGRIIARVLTATWARQRQRRREGQPPPRDSASLHVWCGMPRQGLLEVLRQLSAPSRAHE